MAFTWALRPSSNDLVINKSGKLAVVTGNEEVLQRITVSLRHEWQEYFLNVPAGMPWDAVILGSKDIATNISLIRRGVLSVPGVIGIVDLTKVFSPLGSPRELSVGIKVEVEGENGRSIEEILFTLGGS